MRGTGSLFGDAWRDQKDAAVRRTVACRNARSSADRDRRANDHQEPDCAVRGVDKDALVHI